jgi:hypothetical protein
VDAIQKYLPDASQTFIEIVGFYAGLAGDIPNRNFQIVALIQQQTVLVGKLLHASLEILGDIRGDDLELGSFGRQGRKGVVAQGNHVPPAPGLIHAEFANLKPSETGRPRHERFIQPILIGFRPERDGSLLENVLGIGDVGDQRQYICVQILLVADEAPQKLVVIGSQATHPMLPAEEKTVVFGAEATSYCYLTLFRPFRLGEK